MTEECKAVRHKDRDWSDAPNTFEYGAVRVLMDIRDELKKLNAVFGCQNFQAIPRKLDAIRRQLPTPKKKARHE